MIDLRHELSGFLLKYNGQIGYSVRPSERKKGYACQMLFLVLKKAENFGYKKVLVCCNKANAQSARVIQKCGGALENEVVHEFSPPNRHDIIQRYWIETLIDWVCLSEQIKENNNTIRNLTGEYKKIEPDCREGVRTQLERMKQLCKERNNLYEKQNDLKGQKWKIQKSL